MGDRVSEMYRAAELYYEQGATMDGVARQLRTSRSTVSRLLKDARESGVVRISLVRPEQRTETGEVLAGLFGIEVHVIPVPDLVGDVERLRLVARAAAQRLGAYAAQAVDPMIGIAWGTTLEQVVHQLEPVPQSRATIVQINGAANPSTSGIPYAGMILTDAGRALGERVVQFPVPAFFDEAETRRVLWRERFVRRMLDLRRRMDLAVFSVGSLSGQVASHVYAGGYLSGDEISDLEADGVVGDVCTVMLRQDGSWADIAINARASGMTPDELTAVPHRLCVVGSPGKARALAGALRAGVVTRLVVDDATARKTVAVLRAG